MIIWHLSLFVFPRSTAQKISFIACKELIEAQLKSTGRASLLLVGNEEYVFDDWNEDFKTTSGSFLGRRTNTCYGARVYKDDNYTVYADIPRGLTSGSIYCVDVNKKLTYTAFDLLDKAADMRYNRLMDEGADLYIPSEI